MTRILDSKLARFFLVALVGVLIDVVIFAALVAVGARPAVASIVSNSVAVCVTYVASSRAVFRVRMSVGRAVAYVAWYAVSITGFAFAIDAAYSAFGISPTLWKAASLPVSFVLNFLAVNYVILRPSTPEPTPSETP